MNESIYNNGLKYNMYVYIEARILIYSINIHKVDILFILVYSNNDKKGHLTGTARQPDSSVRRCQS